MSFGNFLEKNISFLIFHFSFSIVLFLLFYLLEIPLFIALILSLILIFFSFSYLFFSFYFKKKKALEIIRCCDKLEDKYYISEVIPKDYSVDVYPYYYVLKEACKSMNDKITRIEQEKEDYQEYIESFAHEIKTPIAALALYFDNNRDQSLKRQVEKIEDYVEQVLYYARSDNTEKDYFVKKIKLSSLVHTLMLKYKDSFLASHIILNVHDLEHFVYTDEKWILFILQQIIGNSIKYFDKKEKKLEIYSMTKNNQVKLIIEDNGCGIRSSDLPRVFDKGFTGSNRKKSYATGIGLYLVKKLSLRLDIEVNIESKYQEYTRVHIIFPKSKMHDDVMQ